MSDEATRNRYLFLDGATGWSISKLDGIAIGAPECDLVVDSLPGTMQPFLQEELKDLECIGAVAPDRCKDRWLIVDRAKSRLRWLDLTRKRIEEIPAVGGRGGHSRGLSDPGGVAILSDGSFVVTDPPAHSVRLFSPFPHALLHRWTDFGAPWGVVAGDGDVLWVVDRQRHHVRQLRRDGTTVATIGEDVLQDPTNIALAPSGMVAVADRASGVVLFDVSHRHHLLAINGVAESVAFGNDGALYAGTSDGLIYKFASHNTKAYKEIGVTVTGLDTGSVAHLLFTARHGLIAVVRNSAGARLYAAAVDGAYIDRGTYVTKVLDSRIEECEWHRLEIAGQIPEGTSIEVTTETAEERDVLLGKFEREHTHFLGPSSTDCPIISEPGRYLRLRIRLISSARSSPRIHALKLFFPRASYLQYLPAVFQEDPESRKFLARFLSIFQASLDGIDERIDDLWQLFEPMAVPEKYLPWLAAWLAVPLSPDWSEAKKREVLDRAFRDEQQRGTVAGLEQAVRDYAGVDSVSVVEHFKLRRWARLGDEARLCGGTRLWSRGQYDRMQLDAWSRIGYFHLTNAPEPGVEPAAWGANEFSVFFVVPDVYSADEKQKVVEQVVEREKPAHTRATVCAVYPRFRVGVQSTVAIDTVVGEISHLVLGTPHATLGNDSILACSSFEHELRGSLLGRHGSELQLL